MPLPPTFPPLLFSAALLFYSEIGARALTVYNLLAAMADSRQSCYPSQKYMAERVPELS